MTAPLHIGDTAAHTRYPALRGPIVWTGADYHGLPAARLTAPSGKQFTILQALLTKVTPDA